MPRWRTVIASVASLWFFLVQCWAEEVYMAADSYLSTSCSGVWSQSAIPGGVTPFIKISIHPTVAGKASLLIYEWRDFEKIGYYNNVTRETDYLCNDHAIANHVCSREDAGKFITHIPPEEANTTSIFSTMFDLGNRTEMALYKVHSTGYYCVAVAPVTKTDDNKAMLEAWVEWRYPYGLLPSADYPKLVLYGVSALVYLSVGLFWGVQTFRYWRDILPVQHFLSGAILFLTIEMAFNWGFWEAYNQSGSPSWALLIVVALLNAGRTSLSFFMLLIVCMGYSVVRPSLGDAMKKCVILACTHFFFGVVYSLGTMVLSPETAGFLILLVIFPLSMTMTAFYVWTLNSITSTLAVLEIRKQHVKIVMYKRLYRLLVFSVIMVVLIFFLNMWNFSDRDAVDWAARNWKSRWFMLDGMLNILYFVVFIVIVILWRPTSNNARYGLEQISQDEDEAMDLENRLRQAEGLGNGHVKPGDEFGRGRRMDDEAGIFELGDDFSDDEDEHGGPVRLVSVNHGPEPSSSSTNPIYSGPSRTNGSSSQPRSGDQTALLNVTQDEDEEDDDYLNDDEHARLTDNARKPS
ncbi:lung seven transmembrane receptor-domain-containing protein [Radiomyces spectabilis]|uniref:lung seven transmembrane receptor-domain-containing protein n=1 Tax=Radiomyces spectabilis TaxID=64574 RepID=UPI0022203A4E|nr:lung seven transmembrane receptor-domain-containing protein [Radiomyces spectabilis]KAI8364748.1 lung seven transmembrane receptor-domain-containing protein [Radiomyces spectabilis]